MREIFFELVTFSVGVAVYNTRRNYFVTAKHFYHRSWCCIDSQLPGKACKPSVVIYLHAYVNARGK